MYLEEAGKKKACIIAITRQVAGYTNPLSSSKYNHFFLNLNLHRVVANCCNHSAIIVTTLQSLVFVAVINYCTLAIL